MYLDEVGLSYLTLDRQTRTLSGGESQRINLAAALGSSLTETMYVIDEPTVGLHARDSERLLAVLRRLKNAGNTVIVVEHDPTIIRGADYNVELGPGAGEYGGEVLYAGPSRSFEVPRPAKSFDEPRPDMGTIRIVNARENNLRGVTVDIPLGQLVAVTGVSGSGKSTLIRNCLYNRYQRDVRGVAGLETGKVDALIGTDLIYDMELVDQSPIGRSSRSNPATYIKAWDEIRKLLADTTGAKLNGVTAGMFSFNTVGGRCEVCQGAGVVTIDMQFLADVEVVCDKCDGRRFGEQVMKVTFKGKNVNDILQLTVDEAAKFFVAKRALLKRLDALRSVGLGYLRLGQSTDSLSGGEAQRLKLASFLAESASKIEKPRLFLFDEPTTGLAHTDVDVLIRTFRDLIDRGNSVLVIEHNMQLIEAIRLDHRPRPRRRRPRRRARGRRNARRNRRESEVDHGAVSAHGTGARRGGVEFVHAETRRTRRKGGPSAFSPRLHVKSLVLFSTRSNPPRIRPFPTSLRGAQDALRNIHSACAKAENRGNALALHLFWRTRRCGKLVFSARSRPNDVELAARD